NIVIGGVGALDRITSGDSTDIVLGDNGAITWTDGILDSISSTDTAEGGTDEITLGNGSKTVIAGTGGDTVITGASSSTTSGIHRVIGDNGSITYAAGALRNISSIDDLNGGQDEISLSGDINQVIGGSDNDIITVSLAVTTASSTDHILGDNGTMNYSGAIGAEQLTNLQSTINQSTINQSTLNQAGDDIITLGSGDKVVIAGKGNDTVKTTLSSVGNRTVLGDEGQLDYDANNILQSVFNTSTIGGDDTIHLGGASSSDSNIVIGGVGSDIITSGNSTDIVLGDKGEIQWTAGILDSIRSTDTTIGGNDKVSLGDGDKTVIGGVGSDVINAASGSHWILGDNGELLFTQGTLKTFITQDTTALTGGVDNITLGNGRHIVMAGTHGDNIATGVAEDSILMGDNGTLRYNEAGDQLIRVVSELSTLGGNDRITTVGGNSLVFGSVGDDYVETGYGNDVIFGDNGVADYINGLVDRYTTTDTTMATSGKDTLYGGGGDDLIFGGLGNELIYAGSGNDKVLGDLGNAFYNTDDQDPTTLDRVESKLSHIGGDDEIHGGDGHDVIIGGGGSDNLFGDAGDDFISGDGGLAVFNNGYLVTAETTELFLGGGDVLNGGDDNDLMFGGFGSDVFFGNLSDDILAGEYAQASLQSSADGFGRVLYLARLAQGNLDLLANTQFTLYNEFQPEFGSVSPKGVDNALTSLDVFGLREDDRGSLFSRDAKLNQHGKSHASGKANNDKKPDENEEEDQECLDEEGVITECTVDPDTDIPQTDENQIVPAEPVVEETLPEEAGPDASSDINPDLNPTDQEAEKATPAAAGSGNTELKDVSTAEQSETDLKSAAAAIASLAGWKLAKADRSTTTKIARKGFDNLRLKQRHVKRWDESKQCFIGNEKIKTVTASDWEQAAKNIKLH
ncbi:beta strand repeat-containing protein, partial [Neptunomonas sp.]|uniref:beta strand repeat-containing protein n=1 Tax=Neptunomonas sp. TaxID=1971898 RepID=UPI0035678FDD